jgi:hypothetical protein
MLKKSHLIIAEKLISELEKNCDLKIVYKSKTFSPTIIGTIVKLSDKEYFCNCKMDDNENNCILLKRENIIHKIALLYLDDDFTIEIV